jgi:hypothetical protein
LKSRDTSIKSIGKSTINGLIFIDQRLGGNPDIYRSEWVESLPDVVPDTGGSLYFYGKNADLSRYLWALPHSRS